MQNLIEGQINYFRVDLSNMEGYSGQQLSLKLDKKDCETHYISILSVEECETYLDLTIDLKFCINRTGIWMLTITDQSEETIYQSEITIYKNKEK